VLLKDIVSTLYDHNKNLLGNLLEDLTKENDES
jgi:hypothetical protein